MSTKTTIGRVSPSSTPSITERRPTMRDVAALAQVSLKTVSRVVNEEAGVSSALATRVRAAIEELDFRPNVGARTLRRADNRTASIGLLLENVANPFSSAVQRAVEDVAVPAGVLVFSASLDGDPVREQALAREFGARHADGLLLVPTGADQSYLEAERRAGTAIVCLDRPAVGLALDSVLSTNRLGAAEAVRHLAAAGHRRIAFLGDRTGLFTADERLAGYREALAESGIAEDPALVVHHLTDSAAADGAVTAVLDLPDPPTALFTAQNLITIGAVRALRRLRAQDRTALVGFDDFPLADLLSPAVTVIAQDPALIGRTAAHLLFARIGGDDNPPSVRLIPTTLVRRGSGEIPPPERLDN